MESITGDRVHVSVHIEGTTNSSFLSELGGIYGPERVLVYQLPKKRFYRLSDLLSSPTANLLKIGRDLLESTPLLNQIIPENGPSQGNGGAGYTRKNLPADTAAVHGHFTPSFFRGVFDNPFISIILKDPLDRMITLFQEWNQKKGAVDWRATIPYKAKMPFQDFALADPFINFQSKSLGNRRLGDYDLVGVADCQAGFIAQLKNKDWTGFVSSEPREYQLHKAPYKQFEIVPEFLEEFQEANSMDYSIYQLAREFMGFC